MEDRITVREIVERTITTLMNIQAPVSMIDSVIIPIRRAVGNLELVIRAWDESEKEETQETQETQNDGDGEGPKIEIVPVLEAVEEVK